jgi:hypothetical protein
MYAPIIGLCLGVALVAASPSRSLLSFFGTLLFAGSALALLVLFAVSIVRSVRSRTLHGGQLLAGGILLLLVLFVVQRLDGPSEETRIERALGKVATSTDPAQCDELMTARYLEQTTGEKMPFADEACESEAGNGAADSVEVREVAVHDDTATATVAHNGGPFDGSEIVVRLLKEDGTWKLDRAVEFARFDRAGFRRAYRQKLHEFGFPARALNCILEGESRYRDEEIEREALDPDDRIYTSIIIGCDREAIERNVIGALNDPSFGFPPQVVECSKRRLKRATDAELMRVQTNIVAYNELILACGRDAFLAFHRHSLTFEADLDEGAVKCVIEFFEALPARELIDLTYEEQRYEAVLDQCESRP